VRLVKNEDFIVIMERAMNLADARLIDHGRQVAYRMFAALYPMKRYDDKQLRDICMLGLLHDIGAYKTEDINHILYFETDKGWAHAIYGYLFIKYFSPIKELAPVILFHHANDDQMHDLCPEHKKLARLLRHCDRQDIQHRLRGNCQSDDATQTEDQDFIRVLKNTPFTKEEADAFLGMIVFSIDFRSRQTMLHTFAASCVAVYLARQSGVEAHQIARLKTAAMLHDIGKMGIPLRILEGTASKLPAPDMTIMQHHVVLSKEVLFDCLDEETLNIAVNHHEKLNGKGYPQGLDAKDLSSLDRIMAVADTFSAMCVSRSYQAALPKDKIIQILTHMKSKNYLDSSIITLAITHYDEIMALLDVNAKPIIAIFDAISEESAWICNKIGIAK